MVLTASGIKVPLAGIQIHLVSKTKPDFDALGGELFQHARDLIRNTWTDVRESDFGRLDRWYEDSAGLHDVFLDAIELFAGIRKPRDLRIVSVAVLGEHKIEASDDDEILRASLFARESVDSGHQRSISAGTTIRVKAPIDSFVALHAT